MKTELNKQNNNNNNDNNSKKNSVHKIIIKLFGLDEEARKGGVVSASELGVVQVEEVHGLPRLQPQRDVGRGHDVPVGHVVRSPSLPVHLHEDGGGVVGCVHDAVGEEVGTCNGTRYVGR